MDEETLRAAHPILKFFEYAHLPPQLQPVSEQFHHLAWDMAKMLPLGAEASVCLRKLLEAKDAAVRAAL